MSALVYRGLLLFFKNKRAVLGSFIGAFILIILYVFLLGDGVVKSLSMMAKPQLIVDTWMLAGVIGIASASSTLGSVSLMIRDKEQQVYTDFMISPLTKREIMLGYFFSTYLISIVITLVTIVASEAYLVFVSKGSLLSFKDLSLLLAVSSLSVLCSTSLMFWIATFFRRMDSFSAIVSIIGPLVGFLTGSYVPIGGLPENASTVVKYFPLTSGVVLIRKILTKQAFEGSNPEATLTVQKELGIVMNYQHEILIPVSILVGSSLIFLILAFINVRRTELKR